LRTDADTDSNTGRKRYAYRDGDSNRYGNSNTDAHTYPDSKGYTDAQSSADPAPAPLVGNANLSAVVPRLRGEGG
jgi:hypothetical protein